MYCRWVQQTIYKQPFIYRQLFTNYLSIEIFGILDIICVITVRFNSLDDNLGTDKF